MNGDRELLQDLAGYITHDIFGHLRKDEFFSPRVEGYSKFLFKECEV